MLQRTKKITTLLISAASMATFLPTSAMAVDKLKKLNGDINKAVAFREGKMYIDGQPDDKKEKVYYLSGSSYSELKDIDVDSSVEIYSSKYLNIDDGDYYVDLSTGKVSDDKVVEEDADKISEKLRKEIKDANDERYNSNDGKNYKTLLAIPGNKFSEAYYKTTYVPYKVSSTLNGGTSALTVYTDASGKYIDADYNLGSIRVKLKNNKTSKVTNTNKDDDGVRGSVSNIKEIGQDASYIYRLADITINSADAGNAVDEINGLKISDCKDLFKVENEDKKVTFRVIQKISKAQSSDDIDGIKFAKNVTNYFVSDSDGDVITLLSSEEKNFSIADGKVLCYSVNSNNIKVQSLELKSKGSTYYLDEDESEELELSDGEDSFDVDVNGNLWAISEEYLYQFDKRGTWDKVYKVDENITKLSVYNKDNMIMWSDDEDVYSIVSNSKSDSSSDGKSNTDNNTNNSTNVNTNTVAKQGWLFENGQWYFYNNNTKVTGWYKDGQTWYYMDGNGIMKTGWVKYNGTWYYLRQSGAMATGWINDGGKWYYLNGSGAMLYNTTVGGYKLGPTGAWIR